MGIFLLLSSVAWIIGWALILEYTIGGSAVARGISPNLVCNLMACLFRSRLQNANYLDNSV